MTLSKDKSTMQTLRYAAAIISLTLLLLFEMGCSTTANPNTPPPRDPPPILTQDELLRPYTKLGRIQVIREVYGLLDYKLTPDIREWGYAAIRAEADKMGADAVILPEVTGTTTTVIFVPSTEYRATGIAIKFK
jgi:hypothetical protein